MVCEVHNVMKYACKVCKGVVWGLGVAGTHMHETYARGLACMQLIHDGPRTVERVVGEMSDPLPFGMVDVKMRGMSRTGTDM